jgi:hypothetical protein
MLAVNFGGENTAKDDFLWCPKVLCGSRSSKNVCPFPSHLAQVYQLQSCFNEQMTSRTFQWGWRAAGWYKRPRTDRALISKLLSTGQCGSMQRVARRIQLLLLFTLSGLVHMAVLSDDTSNVPSSKSPGNSTTIFLMCAIPLCVITKIIGTTIAVQHKFRKLQQCYNNLYRKVLKIHLRMA